MKKLFSLVMMAMLLVMASCSESDSPAMADIRPSEDILSTDDAVPYDSEDLTAVFAALDSLNATMPGNVSRGFWKKFGVNVADLVGGAIGADIAGPIGAIVGYSAASALMEERFENEVAEESPGVSICYELLYDTSICPSEMWDEAITINGSRGSDLGSYEGDPIMDNGIHIDRIGYQHNYAMYEITRNSSVYYLGGELDMDMLFNDVVMFMQAEDLDVSLKSTIKTKTLEIAEIGIESYLCNNSDDDLVGLYYAYLYENGLSSEDLNIFSEFTIKILRQCQGYSADEIHAYALELNNMLKNQNIAVALKVKLATIAQCAVNSALFWQQ